MQTHIKLKPALALWLLLWGAVCWQGCGNKVNDCCYDCSCHYPCPDSKHFQYPYTDTTYLSDTFLSYWYFPIGSWWIYKRVDTTADVYDTAVVVRQDRGIACDCQRYGDVCKERAYQFIDHTYNFATNTQTSKDERYNILMDTRKKDWVFSDGQMGGGPYFTLPFTAAEEVGYNLRYERKDFFKTSQYSFENPVTYHYQNPRIAADSTIRKTNILVKNVGLVYFYDRDNSEWELINYNIIKN